MPPTATFMIDRPAPGVAVVAIKGELDAYSAPDLRDTYVDLINEAAFRQVFDLSAVTRIDSTGLGVIVGALKNLRARGGGLALVVPFEAADVRHALTITGLAKTIPHADTLDRALGLLAPKLEPQDERPAFWPPQVGDVWLSGLDQPSPQTWVCREPRWLSGAGDWAADEAYETFGPLRLVWRDGAVVTAILAQTIRRLLADHEDARKALQQAQARFDEIGDQLAELRHANPDTYADAYREATR